MSENQRSFALVAGIEMERWTKIDLKSLILRKEPFMAKENLQMKAEGKPGLYVNYRFIQNLEFGLRVSIYELISIQGLKPVGTIFT